MLASVQSQLNGGDCARYCNTKSGVFGYARRVVSQPRAILSKISFITVQCVHLLQYRL